MVSSCTVLCAAGSRALASAGGAGAACAGEHLEIMRAEMAAGATEVRRLGNSGN